MLAGERGDDASPQVAVDADPVDEHHRRAGAAFAVVDRARRDLHGATLAELRADRHRPAECGGSGFGGRGMGGHG